MAVQCDLVDTAAHHDQDAHSRQTVRDILRKRRALTIRFQSDLRLPFFTNLFHKGRLSDRFLREVPSYDECDGWAEPSQLFNNWPAEGRGSYRHKHLETVRRKLKDQHWACQALAVLDLIGTVDHAGMQKSRLQLKKCKYASESRDAYFIRPSNGHSSPWI
eukprot:1231968-Pyramimonas_sp.AAC.1